MKVFNINRKVTGLRWKISRKLLQFLLITLVVTLTVSLGSMLVLRTETQNMLLDQALDSTIAYTEGRADTYSGEIDNLLSKMQQLATYTEEIYAHPKRFVTSSMRMPAEFPPDTTGLTLHWVPFSEEDLKDPNVLSEANLLSALEPALASLYANSPTIHTVYLATTTHINVAYDESVLSKVDVFFNPMDNAAGWFPSTLRTGKPFISDTYMDSFGRGLTVTISVPWFVDGEIRGVLGADVGLDSLYDEILRVTTGMDDYALLLSRDEAPICAKDLTEKTTARDLLGSNYEAILKSMKQDGEGYMKSRLNGQDVYVVYSTIETTGWFMTIILPVESVLTVTEKANQLILNVCFLILGLFLLLGIIMYLRIGVVCKRLTEPLISLTKDAVRIGEGHLDFTSTITTDDEIETLSHSFEHMTGALKEYIHNLTKVTAEKERIGAELNVATQIQASMLPSIFPAFPQRREFDLYATMDPAKEVGGDFYDFFMLDERHIAFVVADVSGKGVPAALFMVIGKTLIKDHSDIHKDLSAVFSEVNEILCESNSEGLFITAFEGVLDLCTGELRFVNAGHEMPFITKNGGFEPQKIRAGFVLAGMEGIRYRAGSLQLEPGDKIFQYTDGVTEATNADNQLFGMERLREALNRYVDCPPDQILPGIKAAIDEFVGEAPQFDDITMLCLEYKERMPLPDAPASSSQAIAHPNTDHQEE